MTTTKKSQSSQFPRAIVHKRILDVAESKPNATMEEIAAEVSGGTVELVEQVFEEYGDPGNDESETDSGMKSPAQQHISGGNDQNRQDPTKEIEERTPDTGDETETELQTSVDEIETAPEESEDDIKTAPEQSEDDIEADLSKAQRRTLRLIYEHPTASQREIADMLDVTHTTVYHRLQPIDGFEWGDRWEFVSSLFDDSNDECQETVEQIIDQSGNGILQIDDDTSAGTSVLETPEPSTCTTVFENPELIQKIIHACIDAEAITDDELHVVVTDFLKRTFDADC